jgi:predicted DNA-binding transcriptional regulator YafY
MIGCLQKIPCMPVNKSALIRYLALDRCLQRNIRPFTINGLLNEVNRCLEEAGYGHSDAISIRTLYADLKFMESESGFNATIKRDKKNGFKHYYYDNPEFSVIGLNSILHQEALELIAHIKGILPIDWMNEKMLKNKHSLIQKKAVLYFNHNPYLKDNDWVMIIYKSILEKVVISMKFNEEDMKEYTSIIHPWQLREYQDCWYLLGIESDKSTIPKVIALNNIVSINPLSGIDFIEPTLNEWDELFDNALGPIPTWNKIPEKVILKVDAHIDRMLNKIPMHHSQKRKTDALGQIEYHFQLVHDKELEKQILALGPGASVLKPELLKCKIIDLIHEMNDSYK